MRKLIIFTCCFSISVLCLELFLKYTRITPPLLKTFDENFGSINRPNIDYFKSLEGYFIGSTNYGGRFRENYPKRKSNKSILRILLIGDSFVEGIDVFSRNHFAEYMEKKLSKLLNAKVEILNFGKGNCTLYASSYYFDKYISKEYDYDIVLYFTEPRDLSGWNEYPSTFYKLDSIGELTGDFNWRVRSDYQISSKIANLTPLKNFQDYSFFSLLYRAKSGTEMYGFNNLTFGKFAEKIPEQSYEYENKDIPVSDLSNKIYDKLNNYKTRQTIFVIRNYPAEAKILTKLLLDKGSTIIELSDTIDRFRIRNTNTNALFFKATNSYGGHWNHEGHKAVGNFLANRIFRDINHYNLPNFQKDGNR
jgi:hypothetical protein